VGVRTGHAVARGGISGLRRGPARAGAVDLVVGRPAIVSGHSSGGVVAAWLSAFAKPGQIRAAVWEDAPLFASEVSPACGPSIRQAIGPVFALWNKWLGDQWSIGDLNGMQYAIPRELPATLLASFPKMATAPGDSTVDPMQTLREYDPEWGRAFVSGSATASCDHENLLAHVKVPVLFTHHYHEEHPSTGGFTGAITDAQVRRAETLVRAVRRGAAIMSRAAGTSLPSARAALTGPPPSPVCPPSGQRSRPSGIPGSSRRRLRRHHRAWTGDADAGERPPRPSARSPTARPSRLASPLATRGQRRPAAGRPGRTQPLCGHDRTRAPAIPPGPGHPVRLWPPSPLLARCDP
jgi:hypothetical protein